MNEETSIVRYGMVEPGSYAEKIDAALNRALALDSNLPEWVLDIPGMSGRLYRRFINNLVGNIPDCRYLEIGSWAGSTACAAMAGNAATFTCVDDWSLFGGPKDSFLSNTDRARTESTNFLFIENDFRSIDYGVIGKYNVYLFDGPHEYQDQYDGVKIAQDSLDDSFILIVDDWNWESVRNGTFDAITDSQCELISHVEIRTTQDGSHPVKAIQKDSAWHNGYFIGSIRKKYRSAEIGTARSTVPPIERRLSERITNLEGELKQARADIRVLKNENEF
ncbi:class I SAM-dependent methyltransferase [Novosphingobium sp.]|uniref:class I SAM-dependent methyltransferase n=1 Tax=Novosphingobium sp. TaxID=1874826 RepID=UPI0025D65104|nr:class I SAM-dependent methyltransferase [Novosphingobium sp.]